MNKQDALYALKKCKDLELLTDDEFLKLIQVGKTDVYKKGEEIFTINHKGENFFIVIEGRLLLRLKNNQGREYTKGQLFGEVAILGNTYRFGTVRAVEESMLLIFNRDSIFNSDLLPRELVLKLILALTRKTISYFDESILISSKKLIQKGECDFIEFKKSISKIHKKNIVKTIIAFMNLNGGTIFCGVKDNDGEIIGLENTLKEIDDFKKNILNEAGRKIGLFLIKHISFDIEEIDEKKILRIDCDSSNSPVFYNEVNNENGEEQDHFFVRRGPQNIRIKKTRDIINYIRDRFKNQTTTPYIA